MSIQFDLEQEIMNCWHVIEDMKVLSEGVLERSMTKDEITNILNGMTGLYELKFEKLFNTFEKSIKEKARGRS